MGYDVVVVDVVVVPSLRANERRSEGSASMLLISEGVISLGWRLLACLFDGLRLLLEVSGFRALLAISRQDGKTCDRGQEVREQHCIATYTIKAIIHASVQTMALASASTRSLALTSSLCVWHRATLWAKTSMASQKTD